MHTCIAFFTNIFKKLIGTDDKLYTALAIFLFRLKVLRFFPRLRPFPAITLRILTCYTYRFTRDKEAHIHKLNFSFL